MQHSTVDEIRARFDADVERFSNLDTGQVAALDSPVHLELIAEAAAAVTPNARHLCDLGCGAGNYTLKLLQRLPDMDCTLVDLSRPMLDRAHQRVGEATAGRIETRQGDVREIDLGDHVFDLVVAGQCLHHLREEAEWVAVFEKIIRSLRVGGSLWIADSVAHRHPAVAEMMWRRWGEYLVSVDGEAYRDKVQAYVVKEDTPRPLSWQLELMRRVGFVEIDVLQARSRFASFGGVKPDPRQQLS